MISVIGAGPSGLYSAALLSKKGYDVQVFDQKKEIGHPVQCTGIVTSKINEHITLEKKIVVNKISTIIVNSLHKECRFKLHEPDLVLDRALLDRFLFEKALSDGAKINLDMKFISVAKENMTFKNLRQNKTKNITTDILVGADGPLSRIYPLINPNKKRLFYKGIQARVKGTFEKSAFSVYLGSVCPGFFAWVVPESDEIARVGLAALSNQKYYFDAFLKKIAIKQKNVLEMQGGLIPLYNPKVKTQTDTTYLIGDAACQVKATTGGGLLQDLIAGEGLAHAISNKTNYDTEWRKRMGKELWVHLTLRKVLNRFSDKDFDTLLELLNNKKAQTLLETHSRDTPSEFAIKILTAQPKLMLFTRKLFSIKSFINGHVFL